MKIYLASSWCNDHIDEVKDILKARDDQVYDARQIDYTFPLNIHSGQVSDFVAALNEPQAADAFSRDLYELVACDALVCILPCGRSAHFALGFAVALNRLTVLIHDGASPDLLHLGVDAVVQMDRLDALTPALAEAEISRRRAGGHRLVLEPRYFEKKGPGYYVVTHPLLNQPDRRYHQ